MSTTSTTAIERRTTPADPIAAVTALTQSNIGTPGELMQRIRAMQDLAFVLSPMTGVAMIAPNYQITPVVVVIDPSVDPETGRGSDVYYQPSIHKKRKLTGPGGDRWEPLEVSLNKYALLRILGAQGVNIYPTRRLDDGRERYLWVCQADGDVLDFDGRVRRLPAGTGQIDARDGSADIGEWTPEEWADRVAAAEKRKAGAKESERWKIKPEPINGWTAERVMQVRKYGLQLAETKAMNRMARNLGIRQSYTIEELTRKPFVLMRPVFMPDMSDPVVRQMVTAANLGARHTLYPGATAPQEVPLVDAPVTHAYHEAGTSTEAAAAVAGQVVAREGIAERTSAPPEDAEEVTFEDPAPAVEDLQGETYTVAKVRGKDGRYYIETVEAVTLFTQEEPVARACVAAAKDKLPRTFLTDRVVVNGETYQQIVEIAGAAPKL